jgi:hypothetical protein
LTTTLSPGEVPEWTHRLIEFRQAESDRLEQVYQYLRDPDVATAHRNIVGGATGPLRWLNKDVPPDVRRLAEMSRVNMLKFVVDASVQVMYVDGYRAPKAPEEDAAWDIWQLNKMDSRQVAVHRSALSYGSSYGVVLPGDPVPVIRGASPRKLTAVYGDDDEWPELALELRRSAKKGVKLYRLYDANQTWWVEVANKDDSVSIVNMQIHGLGHVPIVRFLSSMDDDGIITGDVEPLIPLQDQINVTTFGLLVAQHYSAFRQRYIMGWIAESEDKALSATARKLWTFEDPEVKVGEFSQTDLRGYIDSREASLRHLATVSQTPAHELLGQLVNLSADALAAAEANHRRKVLERQTSFGESWEATLALAGSIAGSEVDPTAQVRWRDTEARALSQTADALGKLVAGLGVPAQELWEKIPGVTQQDVDRWKEQSKVLREDDPLRTLSATLREQATGE